MTTTRDDISGLIDGWSCNERNRSADSCRNPCGCHCREITALQARVKGLEADFAKLTDMAKESEALRKNALAVAEQWQARAAALSARVKELEAHTSDFGSIVSTLETRAARLQQERDEAYERAVEVALEYDKGDLPLTGIYNAGKVIAAAIRAARDGGAS